MHSAFIMTDSFLVMTSSIQIMDIRMHIKAGHLKEAMIEMVD